MVACVELESFNGFGCVAVLHVVAVSRIKSSNWESDLWFLVSLEMVSLRWRMSAVEAGVHPLRLLVVLRLCLLFELLEGAS